MSFTVDSERLARISTRLSYLEAGRFITTASLVLAFYDYLITLSEEIDLFWNYSWSITKCLFILNRYSVFVDTILYMYLTVIATNSEETSCMTSLTWFAWMSAIGILFAQIILKLRTWAVWGRNRLVTIVLITEFVLALATAVFFVNQYLEDIRAIPGRVPGGGCIFNFGNRLIFVNFISILISEITVVTLLVIKAIQYSRLEETMLMTCIVRDGLLYFLCILATSIANVLTILLAPVEIHAMLVIFQRVMHSILCGRVLLHIRSILARHNRDETTLPHLDTSFSAAYLTSCNTSDTQSTLA